MGIAYGELRKGRGVNGSAFFTDGMSSSSDPIFISERGYRHGQNVLHRSGVLRTRPGYQQVATLPDGKLQGLWYIRPMSGEGILVAVVAGKAYKSPYPFIAFTQIPNIQLYDKAERVFFAHAMSSATRAADGTISSTDVMCTLIIQDGGYTRAAYWNEGGSGHIDPTLVTDAEGNVLTKGTPLGGPSIWSGNRLWVAQRNKVFAGDISNPFSFVENEYAAEGGFFIFDDDVVAMAEVPSLNNPVLLVFTRTMTYRLQSSVEKRSTWKDIEFQSVFLPDIGCTSSRGVVSKNGVLWWMCQAGLTNLNAASQAQVSSKLVPQDAAMAVSKFNLCPDPTRVALGSYENFVMCSVPYGDRYNTHTWVLDTSVVSEVGGGSSESWAGVWTGTRPVEWATGMFGGVSRVFFASFDSDNKNRVWEAFCPSRTDNDSPISCFVETKTHVDFSQLATGLDRKQIRFAETTFADIVGNVTVEVYWAGTRGKYKLLATHELISSPAVSSGVDYTSVSSNQGQTRVLRTPEVKNDPNATCSSKGIESPHSDWIDVGFSLLIVWSGQASLRSYRIFADPFEEPDVGDKQALETGTKVVSGSVCE